MNFAHGLFVTLRKCFTVPPAGVMILAHGCRSGNVSLRRYYFIVPEVNSMNSPDISDCRAGCSQCSSDSSIPAARSEEIFTGWRLGVAALWVFVLPLALAVTAAIVARWYWPGPTGMLLAALAGLAVGGAISWTASRRIRTTQSEIKDDSNEI